MKVSLGVKGMKELQREIDRMSRKQRDDARKEAYAAGLEVARRAKEKLKEMGTWDLGNLANSIMADMVANGEICEVGPTAPYGPYPEFGTRPHFPPPDALEGWARRHGFDSAWPICKVIAERGLPARPYLHPSFEEVGKGFLAKVKMILERG